jgi:hypothetical protein
MGNPALSGILPAGGSLGWNTPDLRARLHSHPVVPYSALRVAVEQSHEPTHKGGVLEVDAGLAGVELCSGLGF